MFSASPALPWGFESGRYGAGYKLGVAYPTATNGFDHEVRSGPATGFSAFYYPADWFTVGAELDGFFFRHGPTAPAPGSTDLRMSATSLAGLVTGRLNLVADRPWTVYVLGGGGFHRTVAVAEASGRKSKVWDGGRALVAGGGAEAFVLKNLSVAFEARFHEFRVRRSKLGADSFEGLVYLLGFNYWFQAD